MTQDIDVVSHLPGGDGFIFLIAHQFLVVFALDVLLLVGLLDHINLKHEKNKDAVGMTPSLFKFL